MLLQTERMPLGCPVVPAGGESIPEHRPDGEGRQHRNPFSIDGQSRIWVTCLGNGVVSAECLSRRALRCQREGRATFEPDCKSPRPQRSCYALFSIREDDFATSHF